MRAFVAGATGYTGREVVRELASRGVSVIAHVRPDSPRLAEWRDRFGKLGATVDETPWQLPAFEAAFRRYEPTYVFALLGTTQRRARMARKHGSNDSYQTVDYELTSILLNATISASSAARFIYLSSLGVRPGARNQYVAVRFRLESELMTSGLTYIIAHPALITGTDREEFRLGERAAAALVKVFLTTAGALGLRTLRDRFATLTGRQLGRALVNAALDAQCSNVTLEVPQLLRLAKR